MIILKKTSTWNQNQGIFIASVEGIKDLYGRSRNLTSYARADKDDFTNASKEVGNTLANLRINRKIAKASLSDRKIKHKISKDFFQAIKQKKFKTYYGDFIEKETFSKEEVKKIVQQNISNVLQYGEKMLLLQETDIFTLKQIIKSLTEQEKSLINEILPAFKRATEERALTQEEEISNERINDIVQSFLRDEAKTSLKANEEKEK